MRAAGEEGACVEHDVFFNTLLMRSSRRARHALSFERRGLLRSALRGRDPLGVDASPETIVNSVPRSRSARSRPPKMTVPAPPPAPITAPMAAPLPPPATAPMMPPSAAPIAARSTAFCVWLSPPPARVPSRFTATVSPSGVRIPSICASVPGTHNVDARRTRFCRTAATRAGSIAAALMLRDPLLAHGSEVRVGSAAPPPREQHADTEHANGHSDRHRPHSVCLRTDRGAARLLRSVPVVHTSAAQPFSWSHRWQRLRDR